MQKKKDSSEEYWLIENVYRREGTLRNNGLNLQEGMERRDSLSTIYLSIGIPLSNLVSSDLAVHE